MAQHIELGGKKRPIHFGFAAIRQLEQLEGKAMTQIFVEIEQNASMGTMLNIVYSGLTQGARKAKKGEFKTTIETVADWMDDSEEGFEGVMNIFTESIGGEEEKEGKQINEKKS